MQADSGRIFPLRQRGFTLGELLTTVAIVGVSLSMVVPSLASITRSNQRAGAINELVTTLQIARSEAITRNTRVAICPSTEGKTCSRTSWDAGWIRFVDADGDFGIGAGESVLGVVPALEGQSIRTDSFDEAVGYTGTGQVTVPGGRTGGGDFTFCPPGDGPGTVVILSPVGKVALSHQRLNGRTPDCSAG